MEIYSFNRQHGNENGLEMINRQNERELKIRPLPENRRVYVVFRGKELAPTTPGDVTQA